MVLFRQKMILEKLAIEALVPPKEKNTGIISGFLP
jgi:hypothetical protein